MTSLTVPNTKSNYSIIQLGSGVNKGAQIFKNKLSFLPKSVSSNLTDLFFAGSFMSAIFLSMRAFLMELSPKALVGGLVRAKTTDDSETNSSDDSQNQRPTLGSIINKVVHGKASFNWPVAWDECFLELPEYFVMYFLPTLLSTGMFAKLYGGMVGVDFEAIGRPLHEYQKNIGKTVQFGTIQNKVLNVNRETIRKIALGKTALFASVVALCGAMEYVVPSFRVYLTKLFLGIDDFSKLLGFKESLNKDQDLNPMAKAALNVRNGLMLAGLTLPPIIGLTWMLNKRIASPRVESFALKAGKHFDLDASFGLSNTPLAIILTAYAIPGYLSAIRDQAEKLEVINRVILYSIPTIILYKQVVLNFFSTIAAQLFGLGKGWYKLLPQTIRLIRAGERDPLNFNFLSGFGKNKISGEYHGLVTKLPEVQALKPEKRQMFYKTLSLINMLPLVLAPAIGIGINLFNLQQIYDMHKKGSEKRKEELAAA
jgi:hypothetical protein